MLQALPPNGVGLRLQSASRATLGTCLDDLIATNYAFAGAKVQKSLHISKKNRNFAANF